MAAFVNSKHPSPSSEKDEMIPRISGQLLGPRSKMWVAQDWGMIWVIFPGQISIRMYFWEKFVAATDAKAIKPGECGNGLHCMRK